MKNSSGTFAAPSTPMTHPRMPYTNNTPTVMGVGNGKLPGTLWREPGWPYKIHPSNEPSFAPETQPKNQLGVLMSESTTGMQRLQEVLDLLESRGYGTGVSVTMTFNDSDSAIREITLSFPSLTKRALSGISGVPIPSTLTPELLRSITFPKDKLNKYTDQIHNPDQ